MDAIDALLDQQMTATVDGIIRRLQQVRGYSDEEILFSVASYGYGDLHRWTYNRLKGLPVNG